MEAWLYPPERGFSASDEWLTDIITTVSKEYRIAMRSRPRHEVTYSFRLTPEMYGAAKLQARRLALDTFLIPLWAERHSVASLAQGVTAIPKDAANPYYHAGDKVLIYESASKYAIVEALSVNNPYTQINLGMGLASAFSNASIVPLRVASFSQKFSAPRTDGASAYITASARFRIVDGDDFSSRTTGLYLTASTYKSLRVVRDRALAASSVQDEIQQEAKELDTEVGGLVVIPARSTPRELSAVSWRVRGSQARWDLLYWLHTRKGRQKSFYVPTWNKDITLASAVAANATAMVVNGAGFPEATFPFDCMLVKRDGSDICFRVTGAVYSGGGIETLTLENALGVAVQVWEVAQICFMRRMRFASDRIEMRHAANGVSYVSVPVQEVP